MKTNPGEPPITGAPHAAIKTVIGASHSGKPFNSADGTFLVIIIIVLAVVWWYKK